MSDCILGINVKYELKSKYLPEYFTASAVILSLFILPPKIPTYELLTHVTQKFNI